MPRRPVVTARVAIVGAGFSGAVAAIEFCARSKQNHLRVDLIDRSGGFGPGLAYSTTHPGHLMNVRASRLSALHDSPHDFVDWLREQGHDRGPDQFAPRTSYGAYLADHVRRAAHRAGPGALHLVRDGVTTLRAHAGGVALTLDSGVAVKADAVVLALGNQAPAAPAAFRQAALGAGLIDPWSDDIADIKPDDDILMVGAGLTMVDALLRLTATKRAGKIYAVSRHGLTPRSHTDAAAADDRPLGLDGLPSEMLRQFRLAIADGAACGAPWQDVFDRLRPRTVEIWTKLPLHAQQSLLRHARAYWDVHRHRLAPHLADRVEKLRQSGTLEVRSASIAAVSKDDEAWRVTLRPRGRRRVDTLRVPHVINCTGYCADVTQSNDPLINQILQDGIGRRHASGLGFDVDPRGRLVDAHGKVQSRLFVLGPLAQGAYWETTAVPDIRARAVGLAQALAPALSRASSPADTPSADGRTLTARVLRWRTTTTAPP